MSISRSEIPVNTKIASLYAQGLLDYLDKRNFNFKQLDSGLLPAIPDERGESSETSLPDWIRLLEGAADALEEPYLPALAGADLQPRHLGALGLVLMTCTDLQEAYQQLARYIRLLGQIGQPELRIDGMEAHLIWKWPHRGMPPQSVAMFMLAARMRFMRWLSGKEDLTVEVDLHGKRQGDLSNYQEIFGPKVKFGCQQSVLKFPKSYLALPVVTADESLRQQAEASAQALLQELTGETTLVRNLKRIIAGKLASGKIAIGETSRAIHTSPRTLQRRLEKQNTTYQQVLDSVRAESAAKLIADSSIPLAEIAFRLGYRDQSTFQTAYKRWFSNTPGKTRMNALRRP